MRCQSHSSIRPRHFRYKMVSRWKKNSPKNLPNSGKFARIDSYRVRFGEKTRDGKRIAGSEAAQAQGRDEKEVCKVHRCDFTPGRGRRFAAASRRISSLWLKWNIRPIIFLSAMSPNTSTTEKCLVSQVRRVNFYLKEENYALGGGKKSVYLTCKLCLDCNLRALVKFENGTAFFFRHKTTSNCNKRDQNSILPIGRVQTRSVGEQTDRFAPLRSDIVNRCHL